MFFVVVTSLNLDGVDLPASLTASSGMVAILMPWLWRSSELPKWTHDFLHAHLAVFAATNRSCINNLRYDDLCDWTLWWLRLVAIAVSSTFSQINSFHVSLRISIEGLTRELFVNACVHAHLLIVPWRSLLEFLDI